MEKVCTKCNKKYPTTRGFHRDKKKSDGYASHCKLCIRKERITQYEKNRVKLLEYARRHYTKTRIKRIEKNRKERKEIVTEIFNLLGNKCQICGFDKKVALQVDHLYGKGYQHRKAAGSAMTYYKEIKNNIENYQLLCANCNLIEGVRKGFRISIWN